MIQRQPGGYAGNRMKHEDSDHPVFLHRDTARGLIEQYGLPNAELRGLNERIGGAQQPRETEQAAGPPKKKQVAKASPAKKLRSPRLQLRSKRELSRRLPLPIPQAGQYIYTAEPLAQWDG